MNGRIQSKRKGELSRVAIATGLFLALGMWSTTVDVLAQRRVPLTPQAMAPVDVTGYWVTAITEDWRVRMMTPQRGDFLGLPLNQAGIDLANGWDPDADIANGNECRAFGAAGIMRSPTRIHIIWEAENTLRMEFDHGQQTRLVYFDQSTPAGERSWQGHALGEWVDMTPPGGAGRGRGGRGGGGDGAGIGFGRPGALQVVTTNLLHQYHRQNGTPVSENAIVTDIIDLIPGLGGGEWLIVKTMIDDPEYMFSQMVTSSQFKREPDDSKWDPQPCAVELLFESRLPNLRLD